MKTIVTIDVERLRRDMRDEYLCACFGVGFGGALMGSFDIDQAAPEELVEIAQKKVLT